MLNFCLKFCLVYIAHIPIIYMIFVENSFPSFFSYFQVNYEILVVGGEYAADVQKDFFFALAEINSRLTRSKGKKQLFTVLRAGA